MGNPWYCGLSDEAKDFLARLLSPNPSVRLSATEALAHSWLKGKTSSTEPLLNGHADRLLSYQRLQHLRANILAVVMSTQHTKFETSDSGKRGSPVARATTVNMDMFKDTFALFDKDESGDIDRGELEGVMVALGQRLTPYDCSGSCGCIGYRSVARHSRDCVCGFHAVTCLLGQRGAHCVHAPSRH